MEFKLLRSNEHEAITLRPYACLLFQHNTKTLNEVKVPMQ